MCGTLKYVWYLEACVVLGNMCGTLMYVWYRIGQLLVTPFSVCKNEQGAILLKQKLKHIHTWVKYTHMGNVYTHG